MRVSINQKVNLLSVSLILSLGLLLGFYFIRHEADALNAELNERAAVLLNSLITNSEYPILIRDREAISRLAKGILTQRDVAFCRIEDIDGTVLFEGGTKEGGPIREFSSAVVTKRVVEERDEGMILGAPMKVEEEMGKIYLAISLSGLNQKIKDIKETVAIFTIITVILVSLASSLLLRLILSSPIRMLVRGTERIAGGDLLTPMEIKSKDEIGILADSFNRMTKELKRSRDKIGDYSRTLEQKVEERTKELQQEVNERKRAEEKIKASLKEKEMLLKEIHHRVKNNLQVISSLLRLQSEYIEDEQALKMFRDSQNRVRSMALIHEKLYQSKDLARIDFAEYVRSLTNSLFGSYGVNSDAIKLKVNVDDLPLGLDTAIPCGLVINELVSNSFKYAFPDGGGGEIRIDLHTDNDCKLALIVSDNGIGLPEGLDFRNTGSLGLQLVNTLINQLDGTVELDRSGGTEFKITFPRTQT